MIVPFVIASYMGAFLADLIYKGTYDPFWANAAFWLIAGGIIASAVAATIGLIDFLFEPAIRDISAAWWHLGGNIVMSLVSVLDWVLRYEVGPEAGSRAYVWLSLAVALLLVFNGWQGGQLVYKYRVGVQD
ncbi:MAG: DUF2231 domain-containing protein [Alphaproteobacteria bacterium]|nr:DUF2231 domain-containing protein [Alphaproteobacteria bacterium]